MVAAAADGGDIPSDAYKRRRHRVSKGEPVFGRVASGRFQVLGVLSSFSVQPEVVLGSVCEGVFVSERGV